MEDTEKSQNAFLQGAQQELRKEMATLQKKILMDTVSVSEVKLKRKRDADTMLPCCLGCRLGSETPAGPAW